MSRLTRSMQAMKARIAELEELVYVPGCFQCLVCGFVCYFFNVETQSGDTTVREAQCPRGCCEMVRATFQERMTSVFVYARGLVEENERLEARLKSRGGLV